jgi:hypothetical protein
MTYAFWMCTFLFILCLVLGVTHPLQLSKFLVNSGVRFKWLTNRLVCYYNLRSSEINVFIVIVILIVIARLVAPRFIMLLCKMMWLFLRLARPHLKKFFGGIANMFGWWRNKSTVEPKAPSTSSDKGSSKAEEPIGSRGAKPSKADEGSTSSPKADSRDGDSSVE